MPSQYVFGSQGPKGPGKPLLTADTTFYLRQDGNDTQTGAANNIGEAWETLQHAFDWVAQNVSCNGYVVTFQLADGVISGYVSTATNVFKKPDGIIYIHGNATNPENVIITSVSGRCIGLGDSSPGYMVFINNVTMQGGDVDDIGVNAIYSGSLITLGYDPLYLTPGTVRFTGTFNRLMFADYGGSVEAYGTIRLAMSAAFSGLGHSAERSLVFIDLTSLIMDVAQSCDIYIRADRCSYLRYKAVSETGTFIGQKYMISSNSVLQQLTTVPGSIAGITLTGGQVI